MTMKKTIILMLACMCVFMNASAQRNSGRLSLGVGLLYENGMDVTLAYEHEMNYRHAWEFFANGYLKWTECKSCGASAGSDTNKFLAGIHVGYEHNYVLRSGCTLFWQVKSDMMIKGADLLRTGIVLGVKLPIK